MRIKYILNTIGISLLLAASVNGQAPLTLSSALEQALENNYGLKISRADLQVAEINNNWGTAGRYPTIGFDASDNNSYDLNSSAYTNRLSAGVGLNWILFDGFRINNNIKQARYDLAAGQADLEDANLTIAVNVAAAYLNILFDV